MQQMCGIHAAHTSGATTTLSGRQGGGVLRRLIVGARMLFFGLGDRWSFLAGSYGITTTPQTGQVVPGHTRIGLVYAEPPSVGLPMVCPPFPRCLVAIAFASVTIIFALDGELDSDICAASMMARRRAA